VTDDLVGRIASIAAEPVVFDPADQRRELTENTWSVGASKEELRNAAPSQVIAAVRAVTEARRTRVLHEGVDWPTTFYAWHDEQAGQLRLSTASCTPASLPFGAEVRLDTLQDVVHDWLRTGTDVGSNPEAAEPPPYVLPVFAARLEPGTLDERHTWWKRRGAAELRELLLVLWDPIGVFDADEAQDEYDSHAGHLARLLAEGAGKEQLTAELAGAREGMGLDPAKEDGWVAEHLLAWHPKSTAREPLDACLSWGTDQVRTVRTVEDLDEQLDALHARYAHEPLRASVRHVTGATLSIGLGRDVSVLAYIGPAPECPPYYVSRGDLEPGDEEVDWMYGGQHSPCLRRELVPSGIAREAAREFFARGVLLRAIRWDPT
jgi:hypothetical protein